MRFGLYVPSINAFADPRALVELACTAERSGWDGFFLWDQLAYATEPSRPARVVDAWITLSAIAARTSTLRIGPMVTPVARRRPQKLAREAMTLDRLSGGRLILGVGLGAPADMEFSNFGEDADPRVRAEKLDEGLELLARLWTGEPVDFEGAHNRVSSTGFVPTPVQAPRVPIWTAGHWPNRKPIERAARWDGMFPLRRGWPDVALAPDDFRAIKAAVAERRGADAPFDLVYADAGKRLPDPGLVADYAAAGVTWWFAVVGADGSLDDVRALAASPPLAAA